MDDKYTLNLIKYASDSALNVNTKTINDPTNFKLGYHMISYKHFSKFYF